MASSSKEVTLKLLIDTKKNRVLFAEAGKDFVDFLFTLLSLPVGTVVHLLNANRMVGCLGNLYESVENLSDTYMQPNQSKEVLLKPKAAVCSTEASLLLTGDDAPAPAVKKVYKCAKLTGNCHRYFTYDPKAICPSCSYTMSTEVTFVPPKVANTGLSGERGYVKDVVTYMVMDNLVVMPMSTISGIAFLSKCNVSNVASLEEKVVSFGMVEVTFVPPKVANTGLSGERGYVKDVVTYMVMDNLVVMPMSTISGIAFLSKCNVSNVASLEEKVVSFGMVEGLKLLKATLHSNMALTSVFLGGMGTIDASSSIPGDHVTVGETGPITDASARKRKAMSEPPPNEAVASYKPKSKEFNERVEEWFNIIFCCQDNIINEQKRIQKRGDYCVTKLEDQFGAPYFLEGEEEDPTCVSDEEEEDEEEEEESDEDGEDEEDEDDENDD
ncbi:hypothetical protein RHGRI_027499 [Rhododendron griersonianum]|uniref:DUF674 domain-containing protein n=1 Tax=Rhododendron griersonianum TaxID=479676 RepID=A0AAV6J1B7_9ERIC|nr:hypothetical protein RHGRI_027499 [Rhododendron griersonianum]